MNIDDQVLDQVWNQVSWKETTINIDDQFRNKVLISFLGQITNQVRYQVRYQVSDQARRRVGDLVWEQIRAKVMNQVRNPQ